VDPAELSRISDALDQLAEIVDPKFFCSLAQVAMRQISGRTVLRSWEKAPVHL
jgi:hypothetical protein